MGGNTLTDIAEIELNMVKSLDDFPPPGRRTKIRFRDLSDEKYDVQIRRLPNESKVTQYGTDKGAVGSLLIKTYSPGCEVYVAPTRRSSE